MKAKHVAAKAKQDLTKEFSTATKAGAQTLDLDAVDASPVRILRKSEPTPASSPAPPVILAPVISTTIPTALSVTFVIPV